MLITHKFTKQLLFRIPRHASRFHSLSIASLSLSLSRKISIKFLDDDDSLKREEREIAAMNAGSAAKLIVEALLQRFLPLARRRIETAQAQVPLQNPNPNFYPNQFLFPRAKLTMPRHQREKSKKLQYKHLLQKFLSNLRIINDIRKCTLLRCR